MPHMKAAHGRRHTAVTMHLKSPPGHILLVYGTIDAEAVFWKGGITVRNMAVRLFGAT